MGRIVPGDNHILLLGPFLYFSFSFLGLVTSMVIITAICSERFRRKSSPPPPPPSTLSDPVEVSNALNASTNMEATTTAISQEHPHTSEEAPLENTTKRENNEGLMKELPLPPSMQQPKDSNLVKRAASERRLSFNLSMKMPRSMSMARNKDQKEENDGGKKGGKVKADDSVWMKTIILGDKCVPDEEDDAVIYEGKGKKISAYHPKKSTSMSLSREWSSIALDSVPQPQSHEERINNI